MNAKAPRIHRKICALLFLLTCIAVHPLFRPGIFSGHDRIFRDHIRLVQFQEGIRDGNFLPRWQRDFYYGFGYPFFNYYQPLLYYVGAAFKEIGFTATNSLKITIFLITFASTFAMYLCARRLWGVWGGLVSSMLYLFAPYHLADLYLRTSLAEYASFVFFPMIFGSLAAVSKGNRSGLGLAFGIAGLMLCHNAEALIFQPFILSLMLFGTFNKRLSFPIIRLAPAAAAGFGMAAFFWMPAFFERNLVHIDRTKDAGYNYTLHFLSFCQLFEDNWASENSGLGIERFPFSVGWIALVIVAFLAFRVSAQSRNSFWIRGLIIYSLILGYLLLESSAWVWELMPMLASVQFPWRLLAPLTFAVSCLAGSICAVPELRRAAPAIAIALLCFSLAYAGQHIGGRSWIEIPDRMLTPEEIRSKATTTTAANEYLPASVREPPEARTGEAEWLSGSGILEVEETRHGALRLRVESIVEGEICINTFYFPGWTIYVDGIAVSPRILPSGTMAFRVKTGEHEILCRFEDTPVRVIAKRISIASASAVALISLGAIFFKRRRTVYAG